MSRYLLIGLLLVQAPVPAQAATPDVSLVLGPGQFAEVDHVVYTPETPGATVDVTVRPVRGPCAAELSVAFDPATRTVASGTEATFVETVGVAVDAAPGTYQCDVEFATLGIVKRVTVVVPGLSIDDVQVDEAARVAVFTVTLSHPSPTPVSVAYTTFSVTATTGADYTPQTSAVGFPPQQTIALVRVPVVDDTVDELAETLEVALSQPSGAALSDPTGSGTIHDNDRDGVFSCQATPVRVGSLTSAPANPQDLPCFDSNRLVPSATLNAGSVRVTADAPFGQTDQTPNLPNVAPPADGDRARAAATVQRARITVGATVIDTGPIQAEATMTCTGSVPEFAGNSHVSSLRINGVPVAVSTGTLTIALPLGAGTLRLNATDTTATSLTRSALVVDTPLTDVALGTATVRADGSTVHPTGSPCQG
jgi:hypothetical protein